MPPRGTTATTPEALSAARALLAAETGAPAPSLDWDAATATAEAERLGAWLYSLGRERLVPAARLRSLRPAWVAFQRQHLAAVHELGALLDALADAGVAVIPLKGPVLAQTLYRDPASRPFTDLDLLVRPEQARAAIERLTDLGYRHLAHERSLAYEVAHAGAACFVPTTATPHHLPVDLHWSLVSFSGGFVPRGMRDPAIWARAQTVERFGRPMLQLAPDDLLLYLALHLAVHHPLSGLRWRFELAVCLARCAGTVAWSTLVARARDWGVAGAVYFALAAATSSLGVTAPSEAMAAMRPRGVRGRILERLAPTLRERPSLDYLVNLLSLDRAADRRQLVRRGLAPSASWVRARYACESALRGWRTHYGRVLGAVRRS